MKAKLTFFFLKKKITVPSAIIVGDKKKKYHKINDWSKKSPIEK